jgi:hypothetical protein
MNAIGGIRMIGNVQQPRADGIAVDALRARAITYLGHLELCNSRLHEIGHRAAGILFASRVFNGGEVSAEIDASCHLLRRIVMSSDAMLPRVQEALSMLAGEHLGEQSPDGRDMRPATPAHCAD